MKEMADTLCQSYRSLFSVPGLTIWFLGWVIAGVAGPFGTYASMELFPRLLYWIAISSSSIVFGYLGFGLAIWHSGPLNHVRQAWLGAAIASFLVAPVVWGLTALFEMAGSGMSPGFDRLFFYTVLVCTTVAVLRLTLQGILAEQKPPEPSSPIAAPRLVARLPLQIRGEVLRISASDHIVRVVTDKGEADLRMRFSDSVNEMDGIVGHKTHRSHWVARDAISEARRDSGRWAVILKNGDQVPVSRKYQPVLEQAGVLKP